MAQRGAGGGDYPIERRAGEIERLRIQGEALAADTELMLDRIGVRPGWRCLDLACGPRGITDALSARVGPAGHVTGLDFDPAFIAAARESAPANVAFETGDAYRTGLPDAGFDLVHVRFLACTAGEPERLVAEAVRLARPGGYVALQEADGSTLCCFPPHPAWSSAPARLARQLPGRRRRSAGASAVPAAAPRRAVGGGVPPGPRRRPVRRPLVPTTCRRPIESLRARVIERGLIAERPTSTPTLDACRRHLADPETVFTAPPWCRPGAAFRRRRTERPVGSEAVTAGRAGPVSARSPRRRRSARRRMRGRR